MHHVRLWRFYYGDNNNKDLRMQLHVWYMILVEKLLCLFTDMHMSVRLSINPFVCPSLGKVILSATIQDKCIKYLVAIPLTNEQISFNHFVRLSVGYSFTTYGRIFPYFSIMSYAN